MYDASREANGQQLATLARGAYSSSGLATQRDGLILVTCFIPAWLSDFGCKSRSCALFPKRPVCNLSSWFPWTRILESKAGSLVKLVPLLRPKRSVSPSYRRLLARRIAGLRRRLLGAVYI